MKENFRRIYESVSEAPIFYREQFKKAGKEMPCDFTLTKTSFVETFLGNICVNYYSYTSSQNETIYLADIRLADELGDVISSNEEIPEEIITKQIDKFLRIAKKDLDL